MPFDGHFNPLTSLAMYLKEAGCDVRWYTSQHYAPKIEKLGLPFYPLQRAMDINGDDLEALFPDRKKHKSMLAKIKFDIINVFILRGPEYYTDILAIYKEFPFDVMVADVAFGAIPFVKEKMDIPVIAAGILPLCETSRDLPPAALAMNPSRGPGSSIKHAALRYIADRLIFAKPTQVLKDVLGAYGIDNEGLGVFDIGIRKSTVLLQSGTPGFEYFRSDLSTNIHFAGPILPHDNRDKTKRWYDERLNKHEKVILVTQGTVEKDINKLLVPTLEAFNNSDYLVIVTTGGAETQKLKARYESPNIIIEDFIPFSDVLPYADVYVSNGGYGSVLLSIQNGVPMVVAGVHEGKNQINARVGYFRLGIDLRTEKPKPSQVRLAVEQVLAEDKYKQNVTKLKEEFSRFNSKEIFLKHVSDLTQNATIPREEIIEEEVIY